LRVNPRERGAQGIHLAIPFYICVCVCVCVTGSHLTVCLCPTLFDPIDCSPSVSSVHGISQARRLDWVAISSSKGSSQPRGQTHISSIGRWILYHCTSWEAHPSDQIYVVVQPSSRVQLCDPVDCSRLGFPVPHHLPEFAQVDLRYLPKRFIPLKYNNNYNKISCYVTHLCTIF